MLCGASWLRGKRIEKFQAQQQGEIMLKQINFKIVFSVLGLAFLFCAPCYAQQQVEKPRTPREQARNDYGVEPSPDFAQENLRRVAASANQIRAVLVKDEGLLGELRRWVA